MATLGSDFDYESESAIRIRVDSGSESANEIEEEIHPTIKLLQNAAISMGSGVSWGDGSMIAPREQLSLFYRDDRNGAVGYVNLPGTPAELDTLASACHVAAFGRGSENVVDDSYRKALRLDVENFGINFSPERLGLLRQAKDSLLGVDDERTLRAELYKLNVYTEGGFFKAHQDTPMSGDMLGSLVIGMPAAHQGGALVVRNKESEKKFDFSNDGSDTTVRWAAFFSDVEHEVEKVTSGHRITLTYNLFVEKETHSKLDETAMVKQNAFYKLLLQQLKDKEFYPEGGILGFGLKHQYPFPMTSVSEDPREGSDDINSMIHYLKSTDNLLRAIGEALGLKTELKITCRVDDADVTIMTSRLSEFPDSTYDSPTTAVTIDFGAEVIEAFVNRWERARTYKGTVKKVDWVTPMSTKNVKKYDWVAYGNEVSVNHSYGYCSLIMRVPKWSEGRGAA